MVIFFALLSALSYGAADFMGGFGSRKNSALTVVAWSQAMGLLTVLVAAPLIGASQVPLSDILWGMAGGIAGAAGVGLLFRGLASGMASVVSPVAALTGAAIPVFFGFLTGDRPPMLTWAGVALALPAILFLSMEKGQKDKDIKKSLQLGLLSGLAFSGFFIFIAQTGEDSGMYPLLAARSITVPLFFLIAFSTGKKLLPVSGTWRIVLFSGFLDMLANIFYLIAARTGYLLLAVILTALYPAPTVLFQRIFLKEELTPHRITGLILSIAGASLIGVGG